MGFLSTVFHHIFITAKTLLLTVKHISQEACRSIKPLHEPVNREGKYAVITGGNRGIGWYTVKGLVDSGMKVIVGCRDGKSKRQLDDRIQQVGTSNVEWINLDMSSLESIQNFANDILEKNIPIELLINNAGVMFTPYQVTRDGFEQQFAVNYLGHFLLTHLLLPRMVESGSRSRIVSVSSALSSLGWLSLDDLQSKTFYNKWAAYGQSKLAQIMFTETLNARLVEYNCRVTCYAVCPGTIRSNWYENHWYSKLFVSILGFMFKSESDGAQRILHAAFSPDLDHSSGAFLQNNMVDRLALEINSASVRQKLWNISCQLLDIDNFGNLS